MQEAGIKLTENGRKFATSNRHILKNNLIVLTMGLFLWEDFVWKQK